MMTAIQSMDLSQAGMEETSGNWLQVGLRELYEKQRHCDVIIAVQGERFPCHRAVLSAASGFFDAMFTSGMKESNSDVISISDVNSSTFQDILSFIYRGETIVNTKNVESLLNSANMFEISALRARCEAILLDELSVENCLGFWVTGRALQCARLQAAAWDLITSHFDEVRHSEEFMQLGKDDLITIIRDNNLNVSNEEHVCKLAISWIKQDETARKHCFPDILAELRLCQISLEFLLDDIFSQKFSQHNEYCVNLLKDAIKYHALPERRHTFDSLSVRMRKNSPDIMLTLVLGRRIKKGGESITECLGYSIKDRKWFSVASTPIDLGEEFAMCPYGNDIFVSGGTTEPKSMYLFSAQQLKWFEKSKMATGRHRHSMVCVKDSVFVLGGYNFGTVSTVEEFKIQTNTWDMAGQLIHAVEGTSAAVHGERIFLFGGWKGFTEETTVIQCFDTTSSTCTVIGHLPSPQRHSRAITFKKRTYIVFTNGEVHSFRSDGRTELVHRMENFYKKNFGLIKESSTLYILGGCDEPTGSDDYVKRYDAIIRVMADDNDGILAEQLPVPMEVFGCFRAVIRQKYPLVEFNESLAFSD
ncbi:hypothetical protein DPMN_027000 [Dreissena polymorpha]|uniref:BTB domain-containing protein n=1 Tax=Dreissena polymorpha TaxID=45954 RepID=A0A9D4LSA3_DREPO|nr:hypothetical protein DPMN_027000 [Dreissena polymorpha]